jgi:hypothetical protein
MSTSPRWQRQREDGATGERGGEKPEGADFEAFRMKMKEAAGECFIFFFVHLFIFSSGNGDGGNNKLVVLEVYK